MDITFKINRQEYAITSDSRSYTLYRQVTSAKGKVTREQEGYYQNISFIAEKLLKLKLNKSTAKSLTDVLKEMRDLKLTLLLIDKDVKENA